MDWSALFTMQKELDAYIETNQGLQGEELFQKKYLALLVELGELANETRCFKFWSNKSKSSRDVILEEYVDGIHFILSLGIEKGMNFSSTEVEYIQTTETDQFNQVFAQCVAFQHHPNQENYHLLFKSYLQLGYLLGFEENDIQEAYLKKNEKNYARQNEGY